MSNIQQEQVDMKIETWFLNIDKTGKPSKLRRFKNRVAQILIECKTRTEQNHNSYVEYDSNGKIVTVCAMGLLAQDQGLIGYGNDVTDLGQVFNTLGYNNSIGRDFTCGQKGCDHNHTNWSDYIVHLNDSHGRSFDQIGSIFNQIYLRQHRSK
jgi:hypothetical protein